MNLGHPVLQDMIKFASKNQSNIFLAFQSYIELCEVHKAQEVDYHYCDELDLIYLSATIGGENEIYVPFPISSSITPSWIKRFRNLVPETFNSKGIYIMLCDSDTTSVIYKITDGLERPLSPESTKHKKELKEKRGLVEVEIANLLPTLIKEARKKNDTAMVP